jgi:hypothetical protein
MNTATAVNFTDIKNRHELSGAVPIRIAMNEKSKYYKEVIKSRMNRTAANLWGVRNIDTFDSIVKLLIESLASEINKLSNELENIEARLLERLAGILTPDILTAVRPAHMILHARPPESSVTVNRDSFFYYKSKEHGDLHFSPAGDFELINAEVKSLVCAGKMYLIDSRRSKEIRAANGIKPGSSLFLFDDLYFEKTSIVSLTPSHGGKQRSGNPLDAYKYILTSRDRVYTDEDIVNFCYSRYGEAIASVSVKKGVHASARPKEGLIRSIDVHLTLKEEISRAASVRRDVESRLLSLLKSKSPETYNYRVFISNKQ